MRKILSLLIAVVLGVSTAFATTVYCKMTHSWWTQDGAAVAVHYWGGESAGTSWPGVRMEAVTGEEGTWSYDVPADVTGLMFVRVNGSGDIADWGAKTVDLTLQTDGKNLFTITNETESWGDPGCNGEWSVYGEEPAPQVETIYTWYGKRGESSATEAIETGGTAAAYGGNANIVVGTAQKTNWTIKLNKGFSSGVNYVGITLDKALAVGDKLQVAAFRTSTSGAVFGIDFSADAESAATTCQVLFPDNLQTITTNLAPEDTTFTIPECAAGAKFIRIYRNSGSTGVYVANFTILREGGETPEPPVEPTLENGFYLVGSFNEWTPAAEYHLVGNPDNNAEFMVNATLAENDELKVVNVLNDAITAWFPAQGDNYVVDANHAGEKTIYFRPDNQGGEDWFGACIYIAPNETPTPQPAAVVLPATLDVTNVSFRSEGMPNFVIEEGQDYAGTYFDMGAHDSSNDTLLYAEWNVTIQPMKYNIAVDVYNNNSWSVRLYLLNQTGDTVKALYYKGHSGEKGQFAIGSLDLSDLEAGDYKVRARAATGWSEMKLKDVIFTADYQGVNVDLPGTLLPAYAELSAGASIANNAIAFVPSTANNEYAIWNVTFAEAGDYNVTIDMTASNGHTYGVALLSADGESQIGAVAEAQAWDTGVKELGAITVPAAGSYKVKLTNATQWSEAVLNSITFAAPQPQGCDWDNIDFLGDGSPEQTFGNQFKICMPEGMSVVNIQKPGFASESGIYVTFPSAAYGEISLPESAYDIQGAGMILHCSAFTALETEVTVVCDGNPIVFTVYNAKGGTPEPVANYYVIGSMTDWEVSEDYILTPNNEAEGQEFMGEFTFAANDAFKVVKNNKEVWYPDGMGNDFVISEDGDYTVYFRPNGDGGEGWHYGYIYAAKKEATAISNTAADAEAVKVLNNGMLLIRKGNKTYNVMGQAVK